MTIPNALTYLRILATPFSLYFYIIGNFQACAILVLLIALSDFFDGLIARALDQCTDLGALLDPVADKIFEMSFTLVLAYLGDLPFYYVFLLNIRNFSQLLSIPVLMWWKKISFKVEPKLPAKVGSALGMIIILFIVLLKLTGMTALLYPIKVLVSVSAGFEVYMLVTYLPRFVQVYQGSHDTFD
ncbi:MAG: cardiolipin synthase [Bacteriovoracaceae bacterium]|jgi:cardiolipin synthase